MSEPEKTKWVGQLSVELLFQGSKSEGLYPMLDTEDGRRFRVHVQGNQLSDAEVLSDLIEKRVCLNGTADDLRGHWRLTLDPEQPGEVIPIEPDQIKSNPDEQLAPDPNGDIS